MDDKLRIMISWDEARKRAKAEAQSRFPTLSDDFRMKLERITPTQSIYFPVTVTLRTGERRDAVYLCPAIPWFEQWGVWPDEDAGKRWVSLEQVVDFEESPSRLPPRFAEALYAAGESGMGYQIFQRHFRDGSSASFVAGNAIDFPDLPPGKKVEDIVGVTPHAGRDDPHIRSGQDYAWCLFFS